MNGKLILIFIVSVVLFMVAATYRFHDSAHAMGMIRKGGGMARHPALLDKDRDSYVLIATAGVVPPYQGDARVVLEGDPDLTATFHNSGPVLDLGIHRHPEFRNNTYYDLRPRDRVALWVKIKRNRVTAQKQAAAALLRQPATAALPPCTQCEPETRDSAAVAIVQNNYALTSSDPEGKPPESVKVREQGAAPINRGQVSATESESSRSGKGPGARSAKGPAVAFYDAVTNEPLLRIPIRFTGGTGGGGNDH